MPQLTVFLAFATALLYVVAEQQQSVSATLFFAFALGMLVALMAPRRKLLLSLVPPLGGFAVSVFLAFYEGAATDLGVLLTAWIPLALASLVGALIGARLRLFPVRR